MVGRFEALDCKKCGGNLFDVNGEIYKCVYCQTSHVFINDVFVQQSEFEKEELLQTADALLKWRDYDKALSKYKKVADRWIIEVRAWWGITRCLSEDFAKDKIDKYEYEEIQYYAEKAFKTADDKLLMTIRPIWDEYTARVFRYIHYEDTRIRLEDERRAKIERERNIVTPETQFTSENSNSNGKVNSLITKSYSQQSVKAIIVFVNIIILIGVNIGYIALVVSLNIPGAIYNSPACIAPVIIGGLITMAISGVTSGISHFPGLIWVPTVVHAICVIMMISGMLSHSHRFFDSVLVIICFGAVGLGITALIAWLSTLIMCSIRDNFDADYFTNIICNK